jgi:type II secretory pathway component GspD/PulD (secretin)
MKKLIMSICILGGLAVFSVEICRGDIVRPQEAVGSEVSQQTQGEIDETLVRLKELAKTKERLAKLQELFNERFPDGIKNTPQASGGEPMVLALAENDNPVLENQPVATPETNTGVAEISPSTDVSTAPVNYWDVPIEEQTIEDIENRQVIDQAYQEAKAITPSQSQAGNIEQENIPAIPTVSEILNQVISPESLKRTLDLNFNNASLADVILTIGEAAQVNIVLDPLIKNNKLDLNLKGVTVEEALLLIANSYDLGFKPVGDTLFITLENKLREQNLISRLIKVKNIKASEAKAMIKDMVNTINISEEMNSLIVVGQPEEIVKVEKMIRSLDRPQPQVILEAKIIEVNKDALKDLGVDWSDSINIQYQETDRPVSLPNIADAPNSPMAILSMARSPIKFDMLIKILENQNKAKVLSNPRVTTLNNKEAEIFVGDRVPYTVTSITGGVATSDVRFEEPGIRLTITPSIIEQDFVVIKVEPEVSYIFSFRGPNDQYPWVKKRHATAYVRVKNNQPFVLGGLLNEEDKINLYKVPLLGNIPLIGNLFTYRKQTILDTELIITITPKIVYENI